MLTVHLLQFAFPGITIGHKKSKDDCLGHLPAREEKIEILKS